VQEPFDTENTLKDKVRFAPSKFRGKQGVMCHIYGRLTSLPLIRKCTLAMSKHKICMEYFHRIY
jgi:hypothetical protein